MAHNLKKIRYYTNANGERDYVIRVEKFTILKETLKSWIIKFTVKGYGDEVFVLPKSQCKLLMNNSIIEIPLWIYHRQTKLKPKSGNYNRYVYQEAINCYATQYNPLGEI